VGYASGEPAETRTARASAQLEERRNVLMNSRLGKVVRFYERVLEEAISRFLRENALTQSAALAYYMIFSLPSILMIILWTAARFYREVAVREALFSEIGGLVGKDGARQLSATIEGLHIHAPTWWATLAGIGLLVVTATTVLVTMQNTLNRLLEIESAEVEGWGIWKMLHDRLLSTAVLVTISFILLVSLVVDTLISALASYVSPWLGGWESYVVGFDAALLRMLASTALFVMFLRYLPDVRLAWKDICFGALVTTGLFAVGKNLIGLLIGSSSVAGLYEAAGSVLVLLLWVYYSSAVFLFGASFTFSRAKLLQEEREALAPQRGADHI
jgi:membrane protein